MGEKIHIVFEFIPGLWLNIFPCGIHKKKYEYLHKPLRKNLGKLLHDTKQPVQVKRDEKNLSTIFYVQKNKPCKRSIFQYPIGL